MKIFAIAAAALFSSAALNAAELNGVSAADIRLTKLEVPAPVMQKLSTGKCGHYSGVIAENMHLYAQASKSLLYTHAKTREQFDEFVSFWTPMISKFGMKVLSTEYKADIGFGILNYESADGRVIRMFDSHAMNYDALSSTSIAAVRHQTIEALEKAEMTPIAAFSIKNDYFRPSFNVYYLTLPDENPDHEVQLRQLKPGDDLDFAIISKAVTLVRKDSSFSAVYIGKLLGYKGKIAKSEASALEKLENYKKFLAENDKEFIDSVMEELEEPFVILDDTYTHYVGIYFFQ